MAIIMRDGFNWLIIIISFMFVGVAALLVAQIDFSLNAPAVEPLIISYRDGRVAITNALNKTVYVMRVKLEYYELSTTARPPHIVNELVAKQSIIVNNVLAPGETLTIPLTRSADSIYVTVVFVTDEKIDTIVKYIDLQHRQPAAYN